MSARDYKSMEQLNVMCGLSLLRCLGPSPTRYEAKNKPQNLLFVLDWLAGIFAGNDPNVSAAIALDLECGYPTLNVALVPDPAPLSNRQIGQALITMLQSNSFLDRSISQRYMDLIQFTLDHIPSRLQSDIASIWSIKHPISIDLTSRAKSSSVYPRWLEGALEEHLDDVDNAEDGERENNEVRLLLEKLYRDLRGLNFTEKTSSEPDGDRRLINLQSLFDVVTALSDSKSGNSYIFKNPLNPSIHELGRRLHRVLAFRRGCEYLARVGTQVFGLASDANGSGITIRWINDTFPLPSSHGRRLRQEIPPAEYIQPWLEALTSGRGAWDHLKSKVASAWDPEASEDTKAVTHPVAHLVTYLVQHKLDAYQKSIGTTSPVCWACYKYMWIYSDRPTEASLLKWVSSGVSRKIAVDWIPPPTFEAQEVVSHVNKEIEDRLNTLAETHMTHAYFLENSTYLEL